MTEYQKRSINGDSGEYFVAYQITKLFGWPCRLYGVDLGVDAEMEITDNDGISTGDIIKIQIKSCGFIDEAINKSVHVDERHILYWKRFCLPIIICCVDLSSEKIYWKPITATETYKTKGESKKVSFCLENDVLKRESKEKLMELAIPQESKELDKLFSKLENISQNLSYEAPGCYYTDNSIIHIKNQCSEAEKIIEKINTLIVHFPWRLSSIGRNELRRIERNIQIIKNHCKIYAASCEE